MTRHLGDADKRAVDMVLDQTKTAQSGGDVIGSVIPSGDDSGQRITAVTKLLRLLDELPQINPSNGLAERTLASILQTPGSVPTQQPPIRRPSDDASTSS